jgi:serine/threonine-protein kinase
MTSEPPILGRTLGGRFRVTAFIGEGAMASVYRAVQDAEPRDVAIKVLHPHLVSDATFVRRFRREAKAAARIVHPSSVRILDTGVDGKLLYIAMELLSGQDLFETLVLERRLAEARAVRIVAEVCDALTVAHENGVVHRDLKPENIMLVADDEAPGHERVKVLDFGIAKILEPEMRTTGDGLPSMQTAITGVDTVIGTPAYMSPEQCRGEGIDHRSDIYACGVLLYQLLCGRLPFLSASTMEIAVMHVRASPTPLPSIVPSIHPKLSAIVLRALAKWPAQRQQSAAELRDELRALLPELSTAPLAFAVAPSPEAAHAAPEPGDVPSEDRPTIPAFEDDVPAASGPIVDDVSAIPERTITAIRVRQPHGILGWIFIPLAILLGLVVGGLVFLLARPR